MDLFLPWERTLWTGRSLTFPPRRYALSTLRLVQLGGGADEVLLQDVDDVQRTESTTERVLGLSTIVVQARGAARAPFVLRHVRRGAQLAAILELAAGEPRPPLDQATARAILRWNPRTERHGFRHAFIALVGAFATAIAVGAGLHGRAATVTFSNDDAIYPGGEKRDRQAIVQFMETSVMPWAREALAPLKGGPDRVTCETCHGRSPEARDWQMPAVTALPQPDMATRGWEIYSASMDAQTRNAIYGYVAEADNQTKAAYMREVVMPGMAELLHRPAYDFTKPYDYNRTRGAFGCYHCHQVK